MSAVPLCRCRVLYIGSAVPTVTKDGLQGIQQPLRERYPVKDNTETKGIDSWLSVWSNGLLLEYVDGSKKTESAFFQITTLHYCAAVRYVNVSGFSVSGGGERFIPLDTPFANIPDSTHPPIFAAIFRRTSGVKVLECHAFICTNERAANALVRCCFHAYADTIYVKMDEKVTGLKAIKEASRSATPSSEQNLSEQENGTVEVGRDETEWNERAIGQKTWQRRQQSGEYDTASISSSLFKTQKKKNRKVDSRSETADHEGLIVPYHENVYQRRTGSHSDIRGGPEHYDGSGSPYSAFERGTPMPFYGPPPHMMGRPPHMMGRQMPPPPHFFRPPPPGFPGMPMPYPPPPAHFFPHPAPPFGRAPPFAPPFMMPPRGMFMPPPFGMFPPPPPHPMDRPKTPADSGPIITGPESIYDTYPRRGNYEEPVYMPSNGGMPTQSSYKPGSVAPEYYEGYYETYKRHRTPEKKNGSRSESDASADESSQFWEAYEAGIYRKAHLNEKAFGNTLARSGTNPERTNGVIDEGEKPTTSKSSQPKLDASSPLARKKETDRPHTPPADYEEGVNGINQSQQQVHHNQSAAVF